MKSTLVRAFLGAMFTLSPLATASTSDGPRANCDEQLERPLPLETAPDGRVQFQTTFTVSPAPGTSDDDVRQIVFGHIRAWLLKSRMISRENRSTLTDATPKLFAHDQNVFIEQNHVTIATRHSGGDAAAARAWALLFEHDDLEHGNHRIWRTNIGLNQNASGRVLVNLSIMHFPPSHRMIHNDMPLPGFWGAPNVVRQMMRDDRLHLKSGFMPLVTSAILIKPGEVKLLKAILEDQHRSLPVLFISAPPGESARVRAIADKLAHDLAGQAVVFWEARPADQPSWNVGEEMRREFGGQVARFIPRDGMARLYWPGLQMSDPQQRAHHPDLEFDRPEDWAAEDLSLLRENLTRRLYATVHQRGSDQITSVWDVTRSERSEQIRALQSQLRQVDAQKLSTTDIEFLQQINAMYGEDNLDLNEKLRARTTERDDLKARLAQERVQLEDARAELARIASAERFNTMDVSLDPTEWVLDELNETENVVRTVTDLFPGQIVLAGGVMSSVKRLHFTRNDILLQILVGFATDLHRLVFIEKSPDWARDFWTRRKIEVSGENASTKADNSIRRERTVKLGDQTYEGWFHAKWGVKEPEMIRVYFDLDQVNKRIVITHIATHMRTAGTKYQH